MNIIFYIYRSDLSIYFIIDITVLHIKAFTWPLWFETSIVYIIQYRSCFSLMWAMYLRSSFCTHTLSFFILIVLKMFNFFLQLKIFLCVIFNVTILKHLKCCISCIVKLSTSKACLPFSEGCTRLYEGTFFHINI